MTSHTEKFLRQRQLLTALPFLALPFVTMLFWSLGGGPGTVSHAQPSNPGLNSVLPDAHFGEDDSWDKFKLYERAERDSARFEEARESDPYFDLVAFKTSHDSVTIPTPEDDRLISTFRKKDPSQPDPNEQRVAEKLEELYREINKPVYSTPTSPSDINTLQSDPQFAHDMDRLEQMMTIMNSGDQQDEEMKQMESVLEKIIDIQHPERMTQKIAAENNNRQLTHTPVEPLPNDVPISQLDASTASVPDSISITFTQTIDFYSLNSNDIDTPLDNGINAVVHDTQELVAGSVIKMRLLQDIAVRGRKIVKDSFIYGTCAINAERLTIEVNSIRTEQSIIPVTLSVFDLDGMEGIYIPGAITRDAAKQASENALQNVQLMTLNPSLGAQAAAAGVEAAKGLFSKKAKLTKVTVKAGYHILLVDTRATQSF